MQPSESVGSILIIEDDAKVATVLRDTLLAAGFVCEHAADGESGLERAMCGSHDLLILDLTLPRLSGLDICKKVKQARPDLPIIMVTARSEEADVVAGLEVGADDYVQKPFRAKEIVARVRARLRENTRVRLNRMEGGSGGETHPASEADEALTIGELQIDFKRMRILKNGEALNVSAREFQLVALLAKNAGRPFSREDLLDAVWEFTAEDYDGNVSILISRLRKKLEDDQANPRYLLTVRGFGYRFVEASELQKKNSSDSDG